MDRAKLIDVVLELGWQNRVQMSVDRDDASEAVDLILDKLIEITGSPRTVDELTRIRNGA